MAKVLLVQPAYNPEIKNNFPWIPIPILTLGTVIKEKGHEIKILDRNLDKEDNYFESVLKKFNPDIVGMTAYIGKTLIDLMNLCRIVKENSSAITVVEGIQATVEPKTLLDYPYIDYIVRGEGELALLDMCALVDKKKTNFSKIPNINYNNIRPFINLNEFPLPNYDLINVKRYPFVTFLTSRGCPGNCTFCYNNFYWGKILRILL